MEPKKSLKLIIQPKIIEHLGIKLYQKSVDVISEMVANAWDADATDVYIQIQDNNIVIKDNGIGMNFKECQDYYLVVARNRREDLKTEESEKGRPLLGRKGIGKFASFGIAKCMTISTISKLNQEKTVFKLDIEEILKTDLSEEDTKDIEVLEYSPKSSESHGTEVIIESVASSIDIDNFKKQLKRRFLLPQQYDDFDIYVNGNILNFDSEEELEYSFPKDFTEEELLNFPNIEIQLDGWAKEKIDGEKTVAWKIGFFKDTIKEEELRGISIYTRGKLAQKPFFFNLSGGISAQNSLEYMTGQVEMNFIDEGNLDLISTERQRINLQGELGLTIKTWGIDKIKKIGSIWKKRRAEARVQQLEDKLVPFTQRLDNLPTHERKTLKKALHNVAELTHLSQTRFENICESFLTCWEKGRLLELISDISESTDFNTEKLLDILQEADVLTALNIAEAIKTKIEAIRQLENFVIKKENENNIRDFIYQKPWLIHPKWEQFQRERSIENVIKDIGAKCFKEEVYDGRIDMVLASGSSLLIVEFMKPGLKLDFDHLDRINRYFIDVNEHIKKLTASQYKRIEQCYVVADVINTIPAVNVRIDELFEKNILVMDWQTLINQSLKQWKEFLEIIKSRNPNDDRIQSL